MIDWGNVPRATKATLFFPEVTADEILSLSALRQHPTVLTKVDNHTIAVRVADASEKDALIDLDGAVFFTEPHYAGFPAVLVRLPQIDPALLRAILTEGWRCQAPKRLRAALDHEGGT